MLEHLDMERIFHVARNRGYDCLEIYGERRHETQIIAEERGLSTRLNLSEGIALRCVRGAETFCFLTHDGDTHALINMLEQPSAASELTPVTARQQTKFAVRSHDQTCGRQTESPDSISAHTKFQVLENLLRAAFADNDQVEASSFEYHDVIQQFEVCTHEGNLSHGTEESAGALASWVDQREPKKIRGRAEFWGTNIHRFLEEFKTRNPLRQEVLRLRAQKCPWPVPRGELPVFWSSRAFSKLVLLLLRGFEGDLVLDHLSYLTEVSFPLPLPFSISDVPNGEAMPVDHEGSPRKPVVVLQQGQPKSLACNHQIARQLAVPSTGHCRRESFRSPPTVGFWSPVIEPSSKQVNPLDKLEKGICVEDVQVLHFDPVSADAHLSLGGVRLIHQGELGEFVQSFELKINLLKLLSSLSSFSKSMESHALPVNKLNQCFLTEISSPAAVSNPVPIPGEVPLTHYW